MARKRPLPARETRQERQARERAPLAHARDEARTALLVHQGPIEAARKERDNQAESVRRARGMVAEWETTADERQDELEGVQRRIGAWRKTHPLADKLGFPPIPSDFREAEERAAKLRAEAERELENYRASLARREERLAQAEHNLAAALQAARPQVEAFNDAGKALQALDDKHQAESNRAERYESERKLAEMGGTLPRNSKPQPAKTNEAQGREDLEWARQMAREIAQQLAAQNGQSAPQQQLKAKRERGRESGLSL